MKRIIAVLVAATLAGAPALGIFGIGDIVWDPNNEVHLVTQVSQLIKQYDQLVLEYNHLKYMAQRIKDPARYRVLATPWRIARAADTYGRTGSILAAANAAADPYGAWSRSSIPLRLPGTQPTLPFQNAYSNVELTDGMAAGALEIAGKLRAADPQVSAAIHQLEADSLSADPDDNTEIAVLNKINAASVIGIRNQRDANQILISLSEQRIAETKARRDAAALAINNEIEFRTHGKAAMDQLQNGFSAAARAWSF